MGLVTLAVSGLLALIGVGSFLLSDSAKPETALIPAFVGVIFLILGLAAVPMVRPLQMVAVHLAALAAALFPLGVIGRWVSDGFGTPLATAAQVATVVILWGFFALCLKSFLAARRARRASA